MIALHPSAEALLRRIIAAGDAGYPVPDDECGDALALHYDDLAQIQTVSPRTAWATDKGRAFAHRVTA